MIKSIKRGAREDLANLEGQFEETTDLKGTLRITCLMRRMVLG